MTAARNRRKNAKKNGKRVRGRAARTRKGQPVSMSRSARGRRGGLASVRKRAQASRKTKIRRRLRARVKAKAEQHRRRLSLNEALDGLVSLHIKQSLLGLSQRDLRLRRRVRQAQQAFMARPA